MLKIILLVFLVFVIQINSIENVLYLNNGDYLPLLNREAKEFEKNDETLESDKIKIKYAHIIITMAMFWIPTLFILIHLSRNIPINHQTRAIHYVQETNSEKLETAFNTMKKNLGDRGSDVSSFYFYQQWTGYVSTASKLMRTFEQDFDPVKGKMTPEEYSRATNREIETMTLNPNKIIEDDL